VDDATIMRRAISNAAEVRTVTSPNPWVGAVVTTIDGAMFDGATSPPGGPHAEGVALMKAGTAAIGATLTVTLEPCPHHGRTPPCTDAIVAAGVARVVVGIEDPDPRVGGRGIAALRAAGLEVSVGVLSAEVTEQLRPYVTHRRTGRPFVVLKLALTVDGRTALPGGASRWITGPQARADVHRLRAHADAVLVGAGTVRADDPSLTVRHVDGRDPLRVVLGKVGAGARIRPCREMSGDLGAVLDELGGDGVVQLLVEGGATVARDFHRAGLVDRYVLYVAPALAGGDDGFAMFTGVGAATMEQLWRGRFLSVVPLGDDLRIEMEPTTMQRTVDAHKFRTRQHDDEQIGS
jgi:diaminohydroxyphosphoribosylaminopyrimidine deaminase/5-amino-6-(5-phosphoribosylamino)uracil reductase